MFNEDGMDWDLPSDRQIEERVVEKVLWPITVKGHASQAMSNYDLWEITLKWDRKINLGRREIHKSITIKVLLKFKGDLLCKIRILTFVFLTKVKTLKKNTQ